MKSFLRCIILAGSLDAIDAFSATFTVTTTNVTGPGSVQQALFDANTNAGADTINFNIASGGLTISPTNALPAIVEPVTIDGSTQPSFVSAPIIELNGTSAGIATDGLKIITSNCTIRALVINRFLGDGIEIATNGNNVVEGCYLGLNLTGATDLGNTLNGIFITNSPNNIIGGIFSTQRNFISGNNAAGVHIGGSSATNNQLLGNVIGLTVTNSAVLNSGGGVRVNASFNVIGGSVTGARNTISGNSGNGIEILGANRGNQVIGNYIGVDLTGALARNNSADGILINNSGANVIGGSNPGEGNLISGNTGDGIEINGLSATNNLVRGNLIGTTAAGTSGVANSGNGILITSNSRSNIVGGISAGEVNTIAFNALDGISVAAANSNTNNAFRGNSIYSNGDLGIDLGATGVQNNDPGDPDVGANALQNFPELSAATNNGSSVTIAGSMKSTSSTQFALDFFATVLFDPSGNGQGQFYLGSTNVTTGADSNVNFIVTLPVGLSGRYVSATATDPFGNTSEFATNVVARSTVAANTFTVINTNDSGAGSLRAAISNANLSITAGPDLINFAIPGTGPFIIAPSNALPAVADMVIIDGYTQSGASSNTLAVGNNAVFLIRLDGNNAPNNVAGLSLWGGNSTVRGLGITRFKSGFGHGIEVFSTNNIIAGNFIGVGLDGATDLGNGGNGINISSAGYNLIGGTTPAARNLIGGNTGDGIEINGGSALGNIIQGNYLGTDANGVRGAVDLGNGNGINLNNAPATLVGGTTASARNVISDNAGIGIGIGGNSGTNTVIQGNVIGLDVNGAALGNNSHGVSVASSSNTIGGTGAGEANVIAYSNGDGVSVSSGTNNVIRANSIFENGGVTVGALGIDLGTSGVTGNDPGDPDTGANQLQNFPVLTNAVANPASTQIQGTLNSRSNTTYQIDFYSNVNGDPSGSGEGQKWLGSASVVTDANSNAVINATVSGVAFGRFITATATDPLGNTSEFSTNIVAGSTISPVTFTVTNINDSGLGSLRAAISNANGFVSSGNDTIAFNIPGAGPHVIAVMSALPSLTDPVTIDGYTQPGAQTNNLADGDNAVLKIQLSGTNALNNVDGLRLEADGCVVRGLAIVGFKGTGDGIEVVSASNVIAGNFIGLQTDGTNISANVGNGILVSGVASNTIGGATPGERNVISGNSGDGIELSGVGASNNIVAGNFIGTDASGTQDKGNNADGVFLNSAPANTIGGATASARNVISGNGSEGITIQNTTATNNQVLNNYIGTDVTGTLALGNSSHGVQITSGTPSGNQIGSPNPGGNIIAFNSLDGVFVSVGTNNAIRANSIHSNGGATVGNLGIDLGTSGVLANDFPDTATGANLQQNYPVLASAVANPASTTVQGTLFSRPSAIYQLDFFSSLVGDPSGNGEGQKWLGSTNLTTDATGSNVFNVTVSGVVQGRFITATATDPFGNTSEFSPWIRAGSTIPPQTLTVINTNDSGFGSLREAILLNNQLVSSTNNTIAFAIAGAGPHTIAPLSALPVPTESVTIDGYTQTNASANTLSNGNNAVLKIRLDGVSAPFFTDGLSLTAAGGNIIRGLAITRFSDAIELGTNGSNRIEGNFLGVGPDGVTAAANFNYGVNANNSPDNLIGGSTPAARNVISGNNTGGILLSGAGAVNNRVEGNFIGTDFTGTADLGNTGRGVSIESASTNLVGGTNAAARNVISGNNGGGVLLNGTSQANAIQGNFIGTDVAGGAAVGNSQGGVTMTLSTFTSLQGNLIGGTNAGAGNRIALNFGAGVSVQNGTNNAIRGNNIFSNSTLGIDLTFDSNVTPNDPGDPDTGPNQIQNFPILSGATITPVNTAIQGSLNSQPSTTYSIDFFANVAPDPTFPNGEGQQYLGSTNVTTGADSNANFNVTLPAIAIGRHLTVTATDPFGNTSEFSPALAAASTFPPVTFVVTNTLNQGPGSLLQAILNNNATPTATNNVITFNIPGVGPHTIAPTSALPSVVEAVTINGFTQPGSSSNSLAGGNNAVWMIRLTGTNVGGAFRALGFLSSGNIVRGLVINGFFNTAIDLPTRDNVVAGNLIGLELDGSIRANQGYGVLVGGAGNRIGGTAPGDRNVISGNSFDGILLNTGAATNNRIEGNFIGTGIGGTLDRGNGSRGIQVLNAPSNSIGGAVAGAGNVISGNTFDGISLSQGNGTVIQGNFIGTDVTGTSNLANGIHGIIVQQSTNVLIGGTTAAARNLISGNVQRGVYLAFAASNARVVGNYIGTDVSGAQALPNFGGGVGIDSSFHTIGGVGAGEGNVIAFNNQVGVQVSSGTNNAIRANAIFGNSQLGIDLGLFTGVTLNDFPDVPTGPNQQQNYPTVTNAVLNTNHTVVQGTLASRPGTTYQLDFFVSATADASGFGEGQRWLGSAPVTTDGAGNGAFSNAVGAVTAGRFITATATDPNGNTSEFSPWVAASSTIPAGTFIVVNTNNAGTGSLRQVLLDVDLLPNTGRDLVRFAIPGPGPHTIAPLTALPRPLEAVIIDGFTQAGSSSNSVVNGNNAVWIIRLDGTNIAFFEDGLRFTNDNNVVRGLEVRRFRGTGIAFEGGHSNVVEGCFIYSNNVHGVRINGGDGNRVGGTTPAARNVLSANLNYGVELRGSTSAGNLVQGNFIGTDVTGTAALGNNVGGVNVDSASDNLIGNATGGPGGLRTPRFIPGIRNVISGNGGAGVNFQVFAGGAPNGNRVLDNFIGTDVTGTLGVTNGASGIVMAGANNTTIGGTNESEANLIAFNVADGVRISSGTNNAIRGNSMFANGDLGIDLALGGVSQNDAGDFDGGANLTQNFPVLTNALLTASNLIVQGTLNSRTNTSYRLDFYSNTECDPSGNGEGRRWLGSVNVTTGADSNAVINVTLPALLEGFFITATATDPTGNTSEFCACQEVRSALPALDLVVTNTNDSGTGSLRFAIHTNNNSFTATNNLIRFQIAGPDVKTIAPLTQLPTITRPVIIDGFTQPGAMADTPNDGTNTAIWLIRIDGTNASPGPVDGLHLTSSSNLIRGLVIVNFSDDGIELESGDGNLISECLIGIDVDSTGFPPPSPLAAQLSSRKTGGSGGSAGGERSGGARRGGNNRDIRMKGSSYNVADRRTSTGNSTGDSIDIDPDSRDNRVKAGVGLGPSKKHSGKVKSNSKKHPVGRSGIRNGGPGTKVHGAIGPTGDPKIQTDPEFQFTAKIAPMNFTADGQPLHQRGNGTIPNAPPLASATITQAVNQSGSTLLKGVIPGFPGLPTEITFFAMHPGNDFFERVGMQIVTPNSSGTGVVNTTVARLPEGTVVKNVANNAIVGSSQDSTTTTVQDSPLPDADLAITKASSPNPVVVGSNVVYTVTVTSLGPNTATNNVQVIDQLPPGVIVVRSNTTHGTGFGSGPTRGFNLGPLTNGEVAVMTIEVTVTNTVPLTNIVTVSSTFVDDTNIVNNADTNVTTVVTTPPGADVKVNKYGPSTNRINQPFYYHIWVTNLGPSTATGVRITDTLPPGFRLLSTAGGEGVSVTVMNGMVIFDLGTLVSGQFDLVVIDGLFTNAGTFTNSAVVSSTSTDTNSANNTSASVTTVTIINSTVQFTSSTFTVPEGNTAQLIVTRAGDLSGFVTVPLLIGGGTARSPDDYPTGLRINVQFNPGETQKVVMLPTVHDTVPEADEDVIIALANPSGPARLGVPSVAALIIQNNDGPIVDPPVMIVKLINGMVTIIYGDAMYSDASGSGRPYVQYSMALPDSFMTLPGAGNPFTLGIESPGSDFVYYFTDFAGNKVFFRLINAGSVTTGSIAGQIRDGNGNPIPGAFVGVGDGPQVTATDANGDFLLTGVPAGMTPLSFRRVVTVSNEMTGEIEFVDRRIIFDVNVQAGVQTVLAPVIVEIPTELGKPVCNCVPWANIAGGIVSGTGTNLVQTVFANGGKLGVCAEEALVVITGPGGINITNPTRRVTIRPAAGGVWTISSTVCGRTVVKSVTLP